MFGRTPLVLLLSSLVASVTAVPLASPRAEASTSGTAPANGTSTEAPSVKLKQGTVNGVLAEQFDQDWFLGIPFAKPPLGALRFAKPQPVDASAEKVIQATQYGPSCLQQPLPSIVTRGMSGTNLTYDEDCLTINVYRPANVSSDAKLPVMHWVYGGSFQSGSSAQYNATALVAQSVMAGEPIIFVAANYRLNVFGFLASPEVADAEDAALNAGFWDQRLAFQWTKENIAAFGGDPEKVTIFGESAGAISIGAHLISNNGSFDLARGAIMESGAPNGVTLISAYSDSKVNAYDMLLQAVNCTSSASNSTSPSHSNVANFSSHSSSAGRASVNDTLSCLRKVDAHALEQAAQLLQGEDPVVLGSFEFGPVLDNFFYQRLPSKSLREGKVADIPVISGNNVDEGTLFAPTTLNNSDEFVKFFEGIGLVEANNAAVPALVKNLTILYPDDPAQGSPYFPVNGTSPDDRFYGGANSTNQYKRAASLLGDAIFQSTRRAFLSAVVGGGSQSRPRSRKSSSKVWSYSFRQQVPETPAALGYYHSSELGFVFDQYFGTAGPLADLGTRMTRSWISFANRLDPNAPSLNTTHWPPYSKDKVLLQWQDGNITTIPDTYRKEQMDFLNLPVFDEIFGR